MCVRVCVPAGQLSHSAPRRSAGSSPHVAEPRVGTVEPGAPGSGPSGARTRRRRTRIRERTRFDQQTTLKHKNPHKVRLTNT